MQSKYIKTDDQKKKPSSSSKSKATNQTGTRSKYIKSNNAPVVDEKTDKVGESKYIKGSRFVKNRAVIEFEKEQARIREEEEKARQEAERIKREQAAANADNPDAENSILDLAVIDPDKYEYEYDENGNQIAVREKKDGSLVARKQTAGLKNSAESKNLASVEKTHQNRIIATVMSAIGLTLLALILQEGNVHLPFMPSFISLEFSALPELLAAIAYGPVVGFVVVFVKNVLHMLIFYFMHSGVPSIVNELSNLIMDATFVVFASVVYNYQKGANIKKSLMPNIKGKQEEGKKRKLRHRSRFIFIGGTVGSAAVAFVTLFSNAYLILPMFIYFYADFGINEYYFLSAYQDANPIIQNIFQGVLYFNVPYNFIRMFLITLVVSIIYKPISPILHGNLNNKK